MQGGLARRVSQVGAGCAAERAGMPRTYAGKGRRKDCRCRPRMLVSTRAGTRRCAWLRQAACGIGRVRERGRRGAYGCRRGCRRCRRAQSRPCTCTWPHRPGSCCPPGTPCSWSRPMRCRCPPGRLQCGAWMAGVGKRRPGRGGRAGGGRGRGGVLLQESEMPEPVET